MADWRERRVPEFQTYLRNVLGREPTERDYAAAIMQLEARGQGSVAVGHAFRNRLAADGGDATSHLRHYDPIALGHRWHEVTPQAIERWGGEYDRISGGDGPLMPGQTHFFSPAGMQAYYDRDPSLVRSAVRMDVPGHGSVLVPNWATKSVQAGDFTNVDGQWFLTPNERYGQQQPAAAAATQSTDAEAQPGGFYGAMPASGGGAPAPAPVSEVRNAMPSTEPSTPASGGSAETAMRLARSVSGFGQSDQQREAPDILQPMGRPMPPAQPMQAMIPYSDRIRRAVALARSDSSGGRPDASSSPRMTSRADGGEVDAPPPTPIRESDAARRRQTADHAASTYDKETGGPSLLETLGLLGALAGAPISAGTRHLAGELGNAASRGTDWARARMFEHFAPGFNHYVAANNAANTTGAPRHTSWKLPDDYTSVSGFWQVPEYVAQYNNNIALGSQTQAYMNALLRQRGPDLTIVPKAHGGALDGDAAPHPEGAGRFASAGLREARPSGIRQWIDRLSGLGLPYASGGAIDDAGSNAPETFESLMAQQRQLIEGRRLAQMFPVGTDELPVPPGMRRVETSRGVFHYDPLRISGDAIVRASMDARENEVLGLGPLSKSDVADIAATDGEMPVAITERDRMGNELRASVATPSTVPLQADDILRSADPRNIVDVEPLEGVVMGRGDPGQRALALARADGGEISSAYDLVPENRIRQAISKRALAGRDPTLTDQEWANLIARQPAHEANNRMAEQAVGELVLGQPMRAARAVGAAWDDPSLENVTSAGVNTALAVVPHRPLIAGGIGAGGMLEGARRDLLPPLFSMEAEAQSDPLSSGQRQRYQMLTRRRNLTPGQQEEMRALSAIITNAGNVGATVEADRRTREQARYDEQVRAAQSARADALARDKRFADTSLGKVFNTLGPVAPAVAALPFGYAAGRAAGHFVGHEAINKAAITAGVVTGLPAAHWPMGYDSNYAPTYNPSREALEVYVREAPENDPERKRISALLASPDAPPRRNPVQEEGERILKDPWKAAERSVLGTVEGVGAGMYGGHRAALRLARSADAQGATTAAQTSLPGRGLGAEPGAHPQSYSAYSSLPEDVRMRVREGYIADRAIRGAAPPQKPTADALRGSLESQGYKVPVTANRIAETNRIIDAFVAQHGRLPTRDEFMQVFTKGTLGIAATSAAGLMDRDRDSADRALSLAREPLP